MKKKAKLNFLKLITPIFFGVCSTSIWADSAHMNLQTTDSVPAIVNGVMTSRTLQSFTNAPQRSDSGFVVLTGTVGGAGITALNNKAIWLMDPSGSLSLVAQSGMAAPGTGGLSFGSLYSVAPADYSALLELRVPPITDSGAVYFISNLAGPGVNTAHNLSYWAYKNNQLIKLFYQGDALDVNTSYGNSASVIGWTDHESGASQLIFQTNLTGPSISTLGDFAIVIARTNQTLPTIVRGLSSSAGQPSQVMLTPKVSFNSHGDTVFYGTYSGPGIISSGNSQIPNHQVIFVPNSTSQVLVRSGDRINDSETPVYYSTLFSAVSAPMVNASRDVLFKAPVVDASGTAVRSDLFHAHGGVITTVLTTSMPIVGAASGVNVELAIANSSCPSYFLSDDGTISTISQIRGPGINLANNKAILQKRSGQPFRLLLQALQPLPEDSGGALISLNAIGNSNTRFNNRGEIALMAPLVGGDVNEINPFALLRSSNGVMHKIMRQGDIVADGNGWITNGFGYSRLFFNDLSQLLFYSPAYDQSTGVYAIFGFLRTDQRGRTSWFWNHVAETPNVTGDQVAAMGSQIAEISFNNLGETTILSNVNSNTVKVVTFHIEEAPSCEADFNHDGRVGQEDLFSFLTSFFTQSMTADLNQSGTISNEDIFTFLNHYFQGC